MIKEIISTLHTQILLTTITLLIIACVFSSKFLTRFGVPILAFFIGAGILLGSEGLFGIYFDNPSLTREIGNIALCFIIFSGGMDLRWRLIKPIVYRGIMLATISVIITASLTGFISNLIFGFPILIGFLLGAIISPTDAASVFSTLRPQKLGLNDNVVSLLEFESSSNDAMAYMLMLSILGAIANPQTSIYQYLLMFLKQCGFGIFMGIVLGLGIVQILNRIKLNIESMYLIISMSFMIFVYSITSIIEGNSFLAVYIAGFIIGNSSFIRKTYIERFFDGQSWIAQIILFITLGLQVYPSQLLPIGWSSVLLAVALILVIRPISVIPVLMKSKVSVKEQVFISFAGLRGAASIVFATYAITYQIPFAQELFNIVFFIALSSILFQGTSLRFVAKKLDIIVSEDHKPISKSFRYYADEIGDMPVIGAYVPINSLAVGKKIFELGLPEGVRVLAIRQKGHFMIPKGVTVINAGDKILLSTLDEKVLKEVCNKFSLEW